MIKDDREGDVQEFVSRKVPIGWDNMSLSRRLDFWASYEMLMDKIEEGDDVMDEEGNIIQFVDRSKICAMEVWVEFYGGNRAALKRADSIMINNAIAEMEGWKKAEKPLKLKMYGSQRGFVRI